MMLEKQLKVVLTFDSTVYAMEAERVCQEHGISGRLIPVPKEISAGCGLCFAAQPSQKDSLLELIQNGVVHAEKVFELQI